MTYPSNITNLPGYIGYVERAYNQGTIDPTQGEGSLQEFPIDFFQSYVDLNNGIQQNVGGYAPWDFGINDVIAAGSNVHLNIALDEHYLDNRVSVATANLEGTNDQFGFSSDPTLQLAASLFPIPVFPRLQQKFGSEFNFSYGNYLGLTINIDFGDLAMSISELNSWYESHPYSAANWQDGNYWSQPDNRRIFAFTQVMEAALGNKRALVSTPAINLTGFIGRLKLLNLYPGGGDAVTQTVLPPPFTSTSTTPETALQLKFGDFIQNLVLEPRTVEAFASAWFQYLQEGSLPPSYVPQNIPIHYVDASTQGSGFDIVTTQSVPTPGYGVSSSIVPTLPSSLETTFVQQFVQKIKQDFTQSIGNDYNGINLPPNTDVNSLFETNFSTFLDYIIGKGGSTTVTTYDTFIQQWAGFVGPTSILNATGSDPNSQSLITYGQIYDVFYPPGTPEHGQFIQNLNSFVNGFLGPDGTGVFNPSLMIDQWMKNLVKGVYGPQFVDTTSSLDAGNYESVRILNQLYRALAMMVQNIQELAVHQATRLDFYAKYQRVYTEAMEKVPVVIRSPIYGGSTGLAVSTGTGAHTSSVILYSPIDSNSHEDIERRSDFNQLSSAYIESLRSFRSGTADLGNKFQAAFTQSNQAVNSEITTATQILEMVNTIANVIFSQQSKR